MDITSPTYPVQPLPQQVFAVGGGFSTLLSGERDELSSRLERAEWEARTTAALLEILTASKSCEQLTAACQTIANELANLIGCQHIGLAIRDNHVGHLSIVTVSGLVGAATDNETKKAFEAALTEAALSDQVNTYPAVDEGPGSAKLLHRQLLSQTQADWIISSSLQSTGAVVGVWLFLGRGARPDLQRVRSLIEASGPHVAACLDLHRRAERNRFSRWAARILAKHRRRRSLFFLGLLSVLTAASCVPVPYRILAKSRVEPVVRRSISAPFAGRLEKSLVEPGDVVTAGEVLAQMDGREIRLEIVEVEVERKRAEVKRNSALSRHELGAARMAELEVARLDLRLRLLATRNADLEIKSPINGIVLQGDQKRAEGMLVSQGQRLFEIAPSDAMVFEVAIPERDYTEVRPGQEVVVRLDAYPDRKWYGTLTKLHPRSEKWESDHVFVGEVHATNADQLLRPGMNGRATVTGSRHPWIWTMFHKPWEQLVSAAGF